MKLVFFYTCREMIYFSYDWREASVKISHVNLHSLLSLHLVRKEEHSNVYIVYRQQSSFSFQKLTLFILMQNSQQPKSFQKQPIPVISFSFIK